MRIMFNGKELITGSASSTAMLTVTLTADGWDETDQQTVEAPGILADETKQAIQPMPKTTDQQAYYAAGILCIGQDTDKLTFQAETIPTEGLTVYVAVTAIGSGGTNSGSDGGTSEEVYSTEEVRIGTWIDGKPLYRGVIEATLPSSNPWANISSGFPDVKQVTSMIASVLHPQGKSYHPIPTATPGSSQVIMLDYYTEGRSDVYGKPGLNAYCTYTEFHGAKITVIMEYTKTTD